MPIRELPRERVFAEMEKLLLRAARPSRGLALLREWGMLEAVAPELLSLEATPQDPEWHPEGDVWVHTLQVVDEAAALIGDLRESDPPRALTVMLAALCHDLGKPATTEFVDGHVRSRGHEEAGVTPTLALLDRWNVHTLLGYDVRAQVVALVGSHLTPSHYFKNRDNVGDGAFRRLARRLEPELLYRVSRADCLGRTGTFSTEAQAWFIERARSLGVEERPPKPLLMGRHLLEMGLRPGPEIGRITKAVYEMQLDGRVSDLEGALRAARDLLA
jgi:tRNA nucleotidyltransferase (CCA-adding enzyme)